jgi:hypothetical protein
MRFKYVLKYSDEIPLKYHKLKAHFIVQLAAQANSQEIEDRSQLPEKNACINRIC